MTKTYNDIEAVTQLLAEVSRLLYYLSYIIIDIVFFFCDFIQSKLKRNCKIINFIMYNNNENKLCFFHIMNRVLNLFKPFCNFVFYF